MPITLRWDLPKQAKHPGSDDPMAAEKNEATMGRKTRYCITCHHHPYIAPNNRACVTCHDRKVRCNAAEVGIPCTRCVNSNRSDSCVLISLGDRDRGSSKRKRLSEPSETLAQGGLRQRQNPSVPELVLTTNREQDIQLERSSRIPSLDQESRLNVHEIRTTEPVAPISLPTPPLISASASDRSVPGSMLNNSQAHSTSPHVSVPSVLSPAPEGEAVYEDESQLQICREMSQWSKDGPPSTRANSLSQGREVIEYHGGTNSITILSEVLGRGSPKRLVRIVLNDPSGSPGQQRELAGLDDADIDYLRRKGAFDLPPPHFCDKLLRLYFECVYVYAPIFDRVEFVQDYRRGTFSIFLLQAILASAVPYAPLELLVEAGFHDNPSAQKTFFNRARLLYDVGVEKSQLRLLQGSCILCLLHVTLYMEKDYRYWLSNATRIATKMGLHKADASSTLDPPTRKLFRRIWWVIYNRDALLVGNGLDNLQRFHDSDFDTPELTLPDWEDEIIPPHLTDLLPPITPLHKHFLIESCKLSRISATFMQAFAPSSTPSKEICDHLEQSMLSWRQSLPSEMKATEVQEWNVTNIWILVLIARRYVFDCTMYRTMRDRFRLVDQATSTAADSKLYNAMFELDTTIDRILIHKVAQFCPLFLYNCVSTVLALHIERVLTKSASNHERLITSLRIQTDMEFLRSLSQSWSPINWALRMFEVIICRIGLSAALPEASEFHLRSDNPFNSSSDNSQMNNAGFISRQPSGLQSRADMGDMPNSIPYGLPSTGLNNDLSFGLDDLLQEFFAENATYWDDTYIGFGRIHQDE